MITSGLLKIKDTAGAAVLLALVLCPGPGASGLVQAALTPEDAAVENTVEQAVSEQVEEKVATIVDDALLERIRIGTLGGSLDDAVEQQVEEALQEEVEQVVQEDIEDNVDDKTVVILEGQIEDQVEQNVDETIETLVEESVEERVVINISHQVEEELEASFEEAVAVDVEESVEQGVVEGVMTEAVEERVENDIDRMLDQMDVAESRIQKDQWLVMAEPEAFEELARQGYIFEEVTDLPGMGLRLAQVAAPSSFDISEVRRGVIDVLGSDRAEVDLNHLYTAGEQVEISSDDGVSPRTAIRFPADTDELTLRIGMIDSAVDVKHPAFNGAHIHTQSFAPEGAELPSYHGTAIASIIAANSADYRGIAPNAEVYAAAVFEEDPERGEIASTVSLVRALDWLMTSGVDVVNISLAGPPNRLLEAALKRASQQNVLILAAAGNGGPAAAPMYPAAYDSVVAVTAVDSRGQVFRLANRGKYLDLAAPGVGMRHARAGGGYAASSGTSFAVPFAATAAARLRQVDPAENAVDVLRRSAEDLGAPGWDDIYGYGLLRPAS